MRKFSILVIALLLMAVSATSEVNVYVTGSSSRDDEGAIIWKNGVAQRLELSKHVVSNSVFVSGNDVYVAGRKYNAEKKQYVATIWKNGVEQRLANNQGDANSVFVSGNNVYVAGDEQRVATLWKNGVAQRLFGNECANDAYARSVFISGSDVYVAGDCSRVGKSDGVLLWKNGVEQKIMDEDEGQVQSVFVSGNDVYLAGRKFILNADDSYYSKYCGGEACDPIAAAIWKNGVVQQLAEGAVANSVFVSGSDVYVAGNINGIATIWKNGIVQKLSEGKYIADANSIFVLDDDIYVAGYEAKTSPSDRIAILWKNGVAQQLVNGWIAYSVFVSGSASGSKSTATNYSSALKTHFAKGTLGASGKTRPIQMFFQNVSKNGNLYFISGKSKTNAAEDTFGGTLTIKSETKGGSCKSDETELKGSYNLEEKESKTSGRFAGTFTACEKSGKLTKASFKGDWVKHSTGSKTPCNFEL